MNVASLWAQPPPHHRGWLAGSGLLQTSPMPRPDPHLGLGASGLWSQPPHHQLSLSFPRFRRAESRPWTCLPGHSFMKPSEGYASSSRRPAG